MAKGISDNDEIIRLFNCGVPTKELAMQFRVSRAHVVRLIADHEANVCPDCGGTGEVTFYEPVYPGEPHMALVGSKRCHCQDEDEYE